jgi:tetratricopeptide (TPR) repeat protein
MRRTRLCFLAIFLGCTLLAIGLSPGISSAATCEKWAGKVVSLQGTVDAKVAGGAEWQPVKLNNTYCPGDMLRTGRRSRAEVALQNHPLLRLDENSTITFGGMKDERTSIVDMLSGAALFFSRVTRNLEVRTATVNAGVEGTEFFLKVEEGKTSMSIFEGKILASNEAGSIAVTTGQSAVAEKGKAPIRAVVVRPRDAVRWALYYPPVIYARPADLKEDSNDPRFYIQRASQSLTVGRVDEAIADIERAQKLDPKNSDAFALRSIVAVAQNEKGKALDLAQKAVEADPKSPTARIALSYAQQAAFNLQGALDSTNEAVKLDPKNALAWARLAELQQSFGELDKSLDAAKNATALSPDLSRTQTVLGFAYLTQVNTQEAMKAFGKAIGMDQADPLPRLGLGLAKIREGNLEEGRRDLEIAITLDPDNGIFRSYLGKAYFEEKRDKLASGQYEMAKTLDPKDPTPYFYNAIQKQTVNQPVEALNDLQKAIEMNDNRAVYRSRLLLDQDLAARSASLGRIYSDLGFQQRALVEGWTSVNADPSNYSAHRFLADSYSVLPRHEIARVSELLQSQLLQPTNITPIQPSLSVSNLFLISSSGAANLSFNEFNPLFNRNRVALQASGLVGNNETRGGEGIVSGIYNKLSLSAGYTKFKTDGWRENADQDDDIANAFVQYELSYKTSIQAEYRYRNSEFGDLRLKFFPGSNFPGERNTLESNTVRLGARHAFSPSSVVLVSYMHQEGKFRERHEPWPQPGVLLVDLNQPDQKADGGELEYLYRSQYINLAIGGGYFDVRDKVEQLLRFGPPFIPGPPDTPPTIDIPGETGLNLKHGNVYAYSYIKPIKNITVTVGASYDHADSEYLKEVKELWNPKFGIAWTPFQATTIRAAAFRTLKRTLITQQTLEPTQVAGFNQFFDDYDLTETWTYGGAIDQKFSSSLFGGVEYSKRELKVPYLDFEIDPEFPPTVKSDWNEYHGRAYLFFAPATWMSLRAEYMYERLKREEPFIEGAKVSDTHRVPLGINLFHPSGLSSSLTCTYFHQNGTFGGFFVDDPIQDGSDDFWIVDMAINYRLPKRYGFITIGVNNLFDRDFNYFDSDLNNASIQPERNLYVKVSLALP